MEVEAIGMEAMGVKTMEVETMEVGDDGDDGGRAMEVEAM